MVRDTLQHMTTYGHDAADRVTSQALPGGRTVSYGYDANGALTSLTPSGREPHRFTYTPVGLNESYVPPSVPGLDSTATVYLYDHDRSLTDVHRPDGGQVRLRYGATTGLLDSLTTPRGRTTFHYLSTGQVQSVTMECPRSSGHWS
jgi:YD repeat-containing protein